jgi:hypothetical protein
LISYLAHKAEDQKIRKAAGVILSRLPPELGVLLARDMMRANAKFAVEKNYLDFAANITNSYNEFRAADGSLAGENSIDVAVHLSGIRDSAAEICDVHGRLVSHHGYRWIQHLYKH